jgi:hypothetical protein
VQDRNLNDLLPLPLSHAALNLICQRVDQVQDFLQRPILLENVSTYLRYRVDAMSETEFLMAVARRTGCRILLDVNNLYVNQCNHQESALAALAAIDPALVGEIHLAGHLRADEVLIDHHGATVADEVWDLYRVALQKLGHVPTLIEWDTDIPPLEVLLGEAEKARQCLQTLAQTIIPPGALLAPSVTPPVPPMEVLAAPCVGPLQQAFANGLYADDLMPDTFALAGFSGAQESGLRRFARYRGNLVATWEKTLAGAYPVMQALVGDEFFAALACAYGHAHPSDSGDLNQFGHDFAHFLREFPHVAQYPYFPAVAQLEWALHTAFYAPDPLNLVSPVQLAALTPEQLELACFALHPAASLLAADHAMLAIWQAHQDLEAGQEVVLPAVLNQAALVLVCRPLWKPQALALSAAAHAALACLAAGQSFGVALDAAFELDENFDVSGHLQHWLSLNLLQMAPV